MIHSVQESAHSILCMCVLIFPLFVENMPAHSFFKQQPSQTERYISFHSLIDCLANGLSSGESTHNCALYICSNTPIIEQLYRFSQLSIIIVWVNPQVHQVFLCQPCRFHLHECDLCNKRKIVVNKICQFWAQQIFSVDDLAP